MIHPSANHDILENALQALHEQVGVRLTVDDGRAKDGSRTFDEVIRLYPDGTDLLVKIKRWVAHANFGSLVDQMRTLAPRGNGLLIADYVNPDLGDRLKAECIQYIDEAGNAYLDQPPVYIHITGKRPVSGPAKNMKTGSAFLPAGMKIVTALLLDRTLIEQSYRVIAQQAQVALGTVGGVIKDLLAQELLIPDTLEKRLRLADFGQLLDKWVDAYPYRLRDKHSMGTFTTDDPVWWKHAQPENIDGVWGGEVAGAIYTKYLNPKDAIVYLPKPQLGAFLKSARLKRTVSNDLTATRIDIVEPFWTVSSESKKRGVAPELIVYADLITSGDPRNREAALRLREDLIG